MALAELAERFPTLREKPAGPDVFTELLFAVIRSFEPEYIQGLIQNGANVNATDQIGMTPLHLAAAFGSRPSIRALVTSGQCNYLIRDGRGRYPFEVAIESTRDYGIARLLQKKQIQQALALGVAPCAPPRTNATP